MSSTRQRISTTATTLELPDNPGDKVTQVARVLRTQAGFHQTALEGVLYIAQCCGLCDFGEWTDTPRLPYSKDLARIIDYGLHEGFWRLSPEGNLRRKSIVGWGCGHNQRFQALVAKIRRRHGYPIGQFDAKGRQCIERRIRIMAGILYRARQGMWGIELAMNIGYASVKDPMSPPYEYHKAIWRAALQRLGEVRGRFGLEIKNPQWPAGLPFDLIAPQPVNRQAVFQTGAHFVWQRRVWVSLLEAVSRGVDVTENGIRSLWPR